MKRLVLAVAALSLSIGMPACTSSQPTSGMAELKTNNVTGTVSTTLPVNLDTAFNASMDAVKAQQYSITSSSKDALNGVIKAKTANGTSVDITLDKNGDRLTNLSVNASPLHTDVAKALAQKIQSMAK